MRADDLLSMIILLGILPISILVILYLINRTKHRERMALIEKESDLAIHESKENPFQDVLFWGLLATGIGIGLLMGYLLLDAGIFKDDSIQGILAILFGGISLIVYYFLKKKKANK